MEGILRFLGGFFASTLGTIYGGWVLRLLWEWIIVAGFSAPSIGVGLAIGIKYIAGFLTHQIDAETGKRPYGEIILTGMLKSTVFLLFGYAISHFVTPAL